MMMMWQLLPVLAACLAIGHSLPPYLIQVLPAAVHGQQPHFFLSHGPFSNVYLIPNSGSPTPSPAPTWGAGPTNRPEGEEAEGSGPVPQQDLSLGVAIPCPGCGTLP